MNKIISKYFGLLFHDFVKGTHIKRVYKQLLKSQYWSDEKIKEYQLKKLKSLYTFVVSNNEFYKNKYKELILKKFEIKTLDDLLVLPILTKEELRKHNQISSKINFSKLIKTKTGGTTGPPTTVYKDTKTRSFAWGSWYRWYDWMGISYGDPTVTLWGASTVLSKSFKNKVKKRITSFFKNELIINSFNINDNTIDEVIKKIIKKNPVIIKGYLSAIIQLADYLKNKNVKISPKCISTTTETLLPPYREYLENTFSCKVFDQYASTEITGVAFECPSQEGLHISSEHVILEVLNDDNKPVTNRKGRIVITDLDNKAFPLIRYEIGDLGVLSEKKCSCGVKLPLLKSIEGRNADTIILKDGSKVHGVFFTDILYELKHKTNSARISRFQAVQSKPGSLTFKLESTELFEGNYITELKKALLNFFNFVDIQVLPVLPKDKSGKFRYVISKINEQ